MKDFFSGLSGRIDAIGSPLCVGLDPRLPQGTSSPREKILELNRRIVEATLPYAACFKPNLAFYEAWGEEGMRALQDTLDLIPPDVPVIADAKRCDIGPTAEAYAEAVFGRYRFDAVTLSPYMGRDAVDPFLKFPGKGVFLLARTSNPSSRVLQDRTIEGSGEPVYLAVARECASWGDRVGLVVAGNDPDAMAVIRNALPSTWFLAPGIGAQGGDSKTAMSSGAVSGIKGILPVVVRSIAEASDPGAVARSFRDEIVEAAAHPPVRSSGKRSLKLELMKGLIDTGCFKLGDFTLKSGKKSPFYIDLRRVISDPAVLKTVARAYIEAFGEVKFDRLAGIPAAALPLATAVSLAAGKPLCWPRMPAKEHGTGNRVEGEWKPGETVLLLDDLITTGLSKAEAMDILRGEGLKVNDLVVLIERGAQGRKDMEAKGIRLHCFMHVAELFALCEELGMIDSEKRKELEAFARSE